MILKTLTQTNKPKSKPKESDTQRIILFLLEKTINHFSYTKFLVKKINVEKILKL
jgi:hypothetical protein